jgi:hypothetical protein
MKNATRAAFDEQEFRAATPLPSNAEVIVVPDDIGELADLIAPVQQPRPLAIPEPTEVAAPDPAPVVPVVDPRPQTAPTSRESRMRWTGSDYLYAGLVATLLAMVTTIVVILVNVLLPVFSAIAAVVGFVWGLGAVAGPIVGGGGVLVGFWLLAGRLSKPGPAAPAKPVGKVATAVAAVKSPGKAAAAVVTGKPIVNVPVEVGVCTAGPVEDQQPSRARRGSVGRFFLGDDRPSATPAGADPLTSRWLARMRDKESGQSVGAWNGGPYAAAMADIAYGGDFSTAYTMHGDDKCAVSWLLEEADPKGWNRKDSRGTKHGSWSAVNAKYGSGLIKRVIRMNDSGVPLPKIADYVESHTGK